jgi:hypothetical protein
MALPERNLLNFTEQINDIHFQWLSAAHFDQIKLAVSALPAAMKKPLPASASGRG